MKNFITFVLVLITINLFSQNLKTFNGKFEDGTIDKGTATYTYYENPETNEYVKHGNFKYTYTEKKDISTYNLVITGNFKHNKRDGLWSYTLSVVDWPTNGDSYITGTKTLLANYVNGLPDGTWNFNYNAKTRDKLFNSYGFSWTNYQTIPTQSVSTSFIDGTISGAFQLSNTLFYSDFHSIIGQFNENGFMNGKWTFNGTKEEKTMEFKDGVLVKYVLRDLSTGKVIAQEIDDENMTRIKNEFLAGKDIQEDIKKYKIKIDTIDAVEELYYNFDYSFKLDEFKFKYISGDETYNYISDKYTFIDNRNEGKFIYFTQAEIFELEDLSEYKSYLSNIENKMYQSALNSLNSILKKYKNNLDEFDLSKLDKDLKDCEFLVSKEQGKQKARAVFDSLFEFKSVTVADQDDKDLEKIILLLENNLDAFTESEISKLQNKRDEIIKKKEDSKKAEEERVKQINNRKTISSNQENLIKLYAAEKSGYTRYVASKKSNFFSYYDDIYNEYLNNGNLNTDEVILVQERMIYYATNNSKEIERKLKSTTTVKQKIEVFKTDQ